MINSHLHNKKPKPAAAPAKEKFETSGKCLIFFPFAEASANFEAKRKRGAFLLETRG
jgi:hypothetical protein